MGGAPIPGPVGGQAAVAVAVVFTGVIGGLVEKILAVRIIALDIGKIEEDFVVGPAKFADLFIALMEVAGLARAVKMAGHINKSDARIVDLELVHATEVGGDILGGGCGDLAAPAPQDEVSVAIGIV